MDINKIFFQESSHHHYIPQLLIRGFTNSNGQLYVYNKEKDEYSKTSRSPKGIFFEKDRNTIEAIKGIKSSILEEEYYSKNEDRVKKTIRYLQESDIKNVDFNDKIILDFLDFIIELYWRVPMNDNIAKLIINSYKDIIGFDTEAIKNEATFQKIERTKLTDYTKKILALFGNKGNEYINIHQNKVFHVIGDNPILFRKPPEKVIEIGEIDCLMAISTHRILSRTNSIMENYSITGSLCYNLAIIDQSLKYVAGSNLEMLKFTVNQYLDYKQKGKLEQIVEAAFYKEDSIK